MKEGCTGKKIKKKRSIELPVLNQSGNSKDRIRKSQTSRWRAAALILLNLLMIAHFIQWRMSGSTISPIEPSESMYTLQSGAVNAGFIFFSLAILATLIFGRFVCGWGCHILALQDFCAWILKKLGLTPRAFRSRLLVFIPLILALYMFVWPTILRYFSKPANEPLIPGFTNHIITTDFWVTFPPFAVAVPFLFICGFAVVYFLGSKGFCTYGCPYGGFFSIADKVAPGKIRVTDACNQCGHCTATCTSNVLVHAEVKQYGMVVDQGCMKCMDCVSVCPNDALYFGFGKPAVSVSKSLKQNYSLSWPEDIAAALVFALSFFAVWDVYQLIPMLMAVGIALVTTFLAFKSWRLFGAGDTSFYRFGLKSGGKIRTAGLAFIAISAIWIGLIAHSGWVHFHESAGAQAFESVRVPDELALAQSNPAQWLSSSDVENIDRGKRSLATAANTGLFVNSHALPKLAWLEYLSGNTEKGVVLLGEAARHQTGQARAMSLYYRGVILNRIGKYEESVKSLDAALAEREDLVLAREAKGESMWNLGRKQEAVAIWDDAVKRNPRLAVALNMLAGASESNGDSSAAFNLEKQADQVTPPDAYFHWMVGLRLQNVGMKTRAEKHFESAIRINPAFNLRRPKK